MSQDLQYQLSQVARALEKKDYRSASQLLKPLWKSAPDNPLVQLYRARLYEAAKKFDSAETVYRHLLRDAINPKVALQARQGLQRIEAAQKAQRQAAVAQARERLTPTTSGSSETGLLVLEAIPPNERKMAALHMAKVMELDAYTARMQIPNRGWKLYRVGNLGEMQYYGEQIRSGKIPAFWAGVEQVKTMPVFQVQSFQELQPQGLVICENADGQVGELDFNWSEVTQRVDGSLPVMEQVVSIDMLRDRPDGRNGKEEALDYVRVCDLHLPGRNVVLRLCDRTYDYHDGVLLAEEGSLDQYSTRMQWNALIERIEDMGPRMNIWSDFAPFGELAMDFPGLLQQLQPRLTMYEQTESLWPAAFQLYSGLAYCRQST